MARSQKRRGTVALAPSDAWPTSSWWATQEAQADRGHFSALASARQSLVTNTKDGPIMGAIKPPARAGRKTHQ
jgi:hypothetical protein